jgi:two-component system phosphate regulon sensor histidine kinase PhoR
MRRIRVTNRLLDDSAGRPVGLILVLTDLTHLRRLESVRTDFASNVSHELRTPITNIKGYVETLLEPGGSTDPEQTERFLRVISKNADRLDSIVEDMLMLAQLERPDARESLAVDHTRVAPIIDSVVSALGPEAEAKRITLEQEGSGDLCAMVNHPLVEQALTNLVANAIRYSPQGTKVIIRASRSNGVLTGDHVEIEVRDQGPGIAEEHLNRIFERFYRVDKARSRERGGTGLGLAIVKHIMNLHGGRVEVDSHLGKGSVFRLVLPAS